MVELCLQPLETSLAKDTYVSIRIGDIPPFKGNTGPYVMVIVAPIRTYQYALKHYGFEGAPAFGINRPADPLWELACCKT